MCESALKALMHGRMSVPDSPKARVEHVHPRPAAAAAARVFGAREDGVLLYGHVADERQDEQSHAEHDQAEGAEDAHHDASLSFPAGAQNTKQDERRQRECMHSYAPKKPNNNNNNLRIRTNKQKLRARLR